MYIPNMHYNYQAQELKSGHWAVEGLQFNAGRHFTISDLNHILIILSSPYSFEKKYYYR